MLEWFHLVGRHMIMDYGLFGLFTFSFASATIFVPASVEWLFPFIAMAGVDQTMILAAATTGSVFGALLNYSLGVGGGALIRRYVHRADLKKGQRIMNKYGWFGVFSALLLPIPGDPLTVLCGATRMRLWEFVVVVTAAKVIKYYFILDALSLVFH